MVFCVLKEGKRINTNCQVFVPILFPFFSDYPNGKGTGIVALPVLALHALVFLKGSTGKHKRLHKSEGLRFPPCETSKDMVAQRQQFNIIVRVRHQL